MHSFGAKNQHCVSEEENVDPLEEKDDAFRKWKNEIWSTDTNMHIVPLPSRQFLKNEHLQLKNFFSTKIVPYELEREGKKKIVDSEMKLDPDTYADR